MSRRPAVGEPPSLAVVRGERGGVVLSFVVWDSSGGTETCTSPVVRLRGLVVGPADVTADLAWRRRGCAGGKTVFEVLVPDPPPSPFRMVWHPSAEVCAAYEVDDVSATPVPEPICR